ncbi:hypothetical protein THAR02_09814 [Trichoderma harzianum]|uniref:Uncharacterized protein n=1 Tax=Trichoderma harzianum TaxID=5544 RepID=A0A0F9ZCA7_TRIHA|nr:hypothetical protein THAR02_09814 [Trichoderma harzianum]
MPLSLLVPPSRCNNMLLFHLSSLSLLTLPRNVEIIFLLRNQPVPPGQQRHPPHHHGISPRDPQRRRALPRRAPHVALPDEQIRRSADTPRHELDVAVRLEQVGVKRPNLHLVQPH